MIKLYFRTFAASFQTDKISTFYDTMRYFVSLSYRGSGYCGWQLQTNGPSIQAEMERALSILHGSHCSVTGAGRTDAGVNASRFIAHFDSPGGTLLQSDAAEFIYKFNAILPPDIVVHDIFRVADDAHARFDAVSRTYRYYVHTSKDPFGTDFSFAFYHGLDMDRMNEAAAYLPGRRDFSCFEKLHGGQTTSVCDLTLARWDMPEDNSYACGNRYVFTVTANRFLRNMVRAMVGTLLDVGTGKKDPSWIPELLSRGDRCSAGQSVPGHALFLTSIEYPYELISILK